ncbi:ATP-binding protein [Rhizomicrobium electricum]|uniref:histidine kinase n=1 Tax=Rhizomicrobium electricum TaxID=480070 RepID=A0ABP3PV61_9PROT|nr:ATP-binding protein [Rhizomicrobium electricum]NIJ48902.1 PAS domain S-box-containing protein [Rhizomicrobium electricum]
MGGAFGFLNRRVLSFLVHRRWSAPLNEFITARAMLDAQGAILEGMANGADLREIAKGIALLAEKLVPPALCAITLVQPDRLGLKPLAAPSLNHHYFSTLEEIEVGPTSGSTGTAAWRRAPVLVSDTTTDPLWRNLQSFADACGIRSSWALPILHTDGTVLGVLTLYYRDPHEPGDWDWSALNSCIMLIRLALSQERRTHELTASEARWRIGVEATGIGNFDSDFATGVDHWSPKMRQILGVGDDVHPSIETLIGLIHPDDRPAFLERYPKQPVRRPDRPWQFEFRIVRANDGEVRTILTTGAVFADDSGQLRHAVGTIYDITDQRQHEEQLIKAKAEAEAANRAKSRFLASMSHELRTPLNAIIGFSDLVRNRVFGPMTPTRYESYIEDIHQSGTHLLSLINDVLDMAKIEAQKFELVRSVFPIEQLAESAMLLVRPQALAKGLDLVDDIADADLLLDADERAMRQVLVNLLSNAVKFTAPGGSVRLFAEPAKDGGLAIGVEDNGAGMDADGIATALEPFGQIQRDVTAERTGTGLGLPLAKAMIEHHGASFHIESELGIGTRIWAEFPPNAVHAPPRDDDLTTTPSTRRRERLRQMKG